MSDDTAGGSAGDEAAGEPGQTTGSPDSPAVDWQRVSEWASFLLPLCLSVLANLTYGVLQGSVVLIVLGIATPLLLVLAVERLLTAGQAAGWLRWVQIGAVSVVAMIAATIAWRHTSILLLDEYDRTPGRPSIVWIDYLLCIAAPLAVDGLAMLSVLALRTNARSSSADAPSTAGDGAGDGAGAEDEGAGGGPHPVGSDGRPKRTREELRDAARALNRRGHRIVLDQRVPDLRAAVEAAEQRDRAGQADGQGDGQAAGQAGGQAT